MRLVLSAVGIVINKRCGRGDGRRAGEEMTAMKQFLAVMSVVCLLLSGSAAFACDGHGEAAVKAGETVAKSEATADDTKAASDGAKAADAAEGEETAAAESGSKKKVKRSKKACSAKAACSTEKGGCCAGG
jgi:hypothetical protein